MNYKIFEKQQTIFYGPPGTSKTFVAKKFSEYFIKDEKEYVEIVQFHPSYSYEDFIEGIKPKCKFYLILYFLPTLIPLSIYFLIKSLLEYFKIV